MDIHNKRAIFTRALQAHILRDRKPYKTKFGFLLAYIVGRGWLPDFIEFVHQIEA